MSRARPELTRLPELTPLPEPIRLTVLSGSLGSGKTTWLRHQLHRGVFADAYVIINEAAAVPVDDGLLPQLNRTAGRLAVLAGGCACCERQEELAGLLLTAEAVLFQSVATKDVAQRIVLETSGLADPGAIRKAVQQNAELSCRLVVSEVIVAVDAVHGLSQLRTEQLSRSQVEAADCLIVTKVSAVSAGELARLLETLIALNPRAAIFGAERGTEMPLPSTDGAEPQILPELPGAPARAPVITASLKLDADAGWDVFSVWLSALLHARGEDVLRVKGVVRTPAGRLLVQAVRGTIQPPEILPAETAVEDDVMVIIGRGFTAETLQRSLQFFSDAVKPA